MSDSSDSSDPQGPPGRPEGPGREGGRGAHLDASRLATADLCVREALRPASLPFYAAALHGPAPAGCRDYRLPLLRPCVLDLPGMCARLADFLAVPSLEEERLGYLAHESRRQLRGALANAQAEGARLRALEREGQFYLRQAAASAVRRLKADAGLAARRAAAVHASVRRARALEAEREAGACLDAMLEHTGLASEALAAFDPALRSPAVAEAVLGWFGASAALDLPALLGPAPAEGEPQPSARRAEAFARALAEALARDPSLSAPVSLRLDAGRPFFSSGTPEPAPEVEPPGRRTASKEAGKRDKPKSKAGSRGGERVDPAAPAAGDGAQTAEAPAPAPKPAPGPSGPAAPFRSPYLVSPRLPFERVFRTFSALYSCRCQDRFRAALADLDAFLAELDEEIALEEEKEEQRRNPAPKDSKKKEPARQSRFPEDLDIWSLREQLGVLRDELARVPLENREAALSALSAATLDELLTGLVYLRYVVGREEPEESQVPNAPGSEGEPARAPSAAAAGAGNGIAGGAVGEAGNAPSAASPGGGEPKDGEGASEPGSGQVESQTAGEAPGEAADGASEASRGEGVAFVCVSGHYCSGKTMFASELAQQLSAAGVVSGVVDAPPALREIYSTVSASPPASQPSPGPVEEGGPAEAGEEAAEAASSPPSPGPADAPPSRPEGLDGAALAAFFDEVRRSAEDSGYRLIVLDNFPTSAEQLRIAEEVLRGPLPAAGEPPLSVSHSSFVALVNLASADPEAALQRAHGRLFEASRPPFSAEDQQRLAEPGYMHSVSLVPVCNNDVARSPFPAPEDSLLRSAGSEGAGPELAGAADAGAGEDAGSADGTPILTLSTASLGAESGPSAGEPAPARCCQADGFLSDAQGPVPPAEGAQQPGLPASQGGNSGATEPFQDAPEIAITELHANLADPAALESVTSLAAENRLLFGAPVVDLAQAFEQRRRLTLELRGAYAGTRHALFFSTSEGEAPGAERAEPGEQDGQASVPEGPGEETPATPASRPVLLLEDPVYAEMDADSLFASGNPQAAVSEAVRGVAEQILTRLGAEGPPPAGLRGALRPESFGPEQVASGEFARSLLRALEVPTSDLPEGALGAAARQREEQEAQAKAKKPAAKGGKKEDEPELEAPHPLARTVLPGPLADLIDAFLPAAREISSARSAACGAAAASFSGALAAADRLLTLERADVLQAQQRAYAGMTAAVEEIFTRFVDYYAEIDPETRGQAAVCSDCLLLIDRCNAEAMELQRAAAAEVQAGLDEALASYARLAAQVHPGSDLEVVRALLAAEPAPAEEASPRRQAGKGKAEKPEEAPERNPVGSSLAVYLCMAERGLFEAGLADVHALYRLDAFLAEYHAGDLCASAGARGARLVRTLEEFRQLVPQKAQKGLEPSFSALAEVLQLAGLGWEDFRAQAEARLEASLAAQGQAAAALDVGAQARAAACQALLDQLGVLEAPPLVAEGGAVVSPPLHPYFLSLASRLRAEASRKLRGLLDEALAMLKAYGQGLGALLREYRAEADRLAQGALSLVASATRALQGVAARGGPLRAIEFDADAGLISLREE